MKIALKPLVWASLALAAISCSSQEQFVQVKDGRFIRDGKPYSFVGTNFWYGPILASDGEGGDYQRLVRELDTLNALGINNLRTLVGADGEGGVFSRVEPTLQQQPGVYNDTLLVGLDRYLAELGKRGMQTVLYLNNSWEWSGGYGQYLEWATGEKALIPLIDGYWPFMQQMRKFQTSEASQELFYNHIRAIVSRTNSVTGKAYKDDPAIFAWQIGNEPRCFSDEPEIRDGFIGWLTESARIIKELDPNHMVSTGNEGLMGCEQDTELLKKVNTIPGIDYMTIHIWPYNWGWVSMENPEEGIENAIRKTDEYLQLHAELAKELGMPVVAEEFGYLRTGARDKYYEYVFSQIGKTLDGANFWGWSGFAVPLHSQWEKGDPYTADPAQEAQGLNGVYATDGSTLEAITTAIKNLNQYN